MIETPERISPECVIRAYEVTGFKPDPDNYFTEGSRESATGGCAFATLATAGYFGNIPNTSEEVRSLINRELGFPRASAFEVGFLEGHSGAYGVNDFCLARSVQRGAEVGVLRSEVYQWYEDGIAVGEAVQEWYESREDSPGEPPRLTYDEVVTAYRETGIEPCTGRVFRRRGLLEQTLGCALGVVSVWREWVPLEVGLKEESQVWYEFFERYGGLYTETLAFGFDSGYGGESQEEVDRKRELHAEHPDPRRLQGYEDGLEIGKRIREEGIPSPVPDYPPTQMVEVPA